MDYFVKWLSNALEVEQYNVLKAGRLNQTDQGQGALLDAINGVLEQGVSNGGMAPGQVDPQAQAEIRAATGNPNFDGYLSTGYLAVGRFVCQPIARQPSGP